MLSHEVKQVPGQSNDALQPWTRCNSTSTLTVSTLGNGEHSCNELSRHKQRGGACILLIACTTHRLIMSPVSVQVPVPSLRSTKVRYR